MRRRLLQCTVLVPCIALAVSSAATQVAAYRLHYDPRLGPSVLAHAYWPWRWLTWSNAGWGDYDRPTFAIVQAILFGSVSLGAFTLMSAARRKPKEHSDVHGTARYLTYKETRNAGLLLDKDQDAGSLILGAWKHKDGRLDYLRHAGNEHIFTTAPMRSGKAQPLDSKVLTPTGWRCMGDLCVGDLVTGHDGRLAPVTGVFPQGEKEIYRVSFEDGRAVECCDEHLWKVWDGHHQHTTKGIYGPRKVESSSGWSVLPLRQIARWFQKGLLKSKTAAVPLVSPFSIEMPPQDLPIPPYVLGVLLGDGHFAKHGVQLTSQDCHILDRVSSDLPEFHVVKHPGKFAYGIVMRERAKHTLGERSLRASDTMQHVPRTGPGNGCVLAYQGRSQTLAAWAMERGIPRKKLHQRIAVLGWSLGQALGFEPRSSPREAYSPLHRSLRGLGLQETRSHDKFVPAPYKAGNVAQRLGLLQGLMDTDGSVGNGTHATFTSTSEQLAKDVQEIVWSLGGRAKINQRQTFFIHKGEKKAGRPSWRVSIVHPDVSHFFSLPRKIEACRPKKMQHRLRISSITPLGRKPAQCIAVGHPDHLYVTNNYIVTHNSHGLAIPNLVTYPYSTVVFDPKGELWDLTAGWRSREGGNTILRFELGGMDNTARYNFFDDVRLGTEYEHLDMSSLMEAIADPAGKGLDGHFDPVAATLLIGIGLHVMYAKRAQGLKACLPDVLYALSSPDDKDGRLFKDMADNRHLNGQRHDGIARIGASVVKKEPRERSNVVSTCERMLRQLHDPILAKNLSISDFSMMDLMNHEKPVSLYVVLPESQRIPYLPLVRLFFTKMMDRLLSEPMRDGKSPHRWPLLMVMDEFAALRTMESFVSAMERCPGYNIRVWLMLQDHEQLIRDYTQNETVTAMCHIRIAYTPNDIKTAKWICETLGTITVNKEDISESGSQGKLSSSRSYHQTGRNLMNPDEVLRIQLPKKEGIKIVAPGQQILFLAGQFPIMGCQSLWFFDQELTRRVEFPKAKSQMITHTPQRKRA